MLQDFPKRQHHLLLPCPHFSRHYIFSLPLFFFLIFWADRGRQFLAQPPQPVLCGEPENFGRRQGHKARGRHSTEVAGECRCQRSSRGGIKSPAGFGRDDGRTGLFLSRRLIFLFDHIYMETWIRIGKPGAGRVCHTLISVLCIWCVWY